MKLSSEKLKQAILSKTNEELYDVLHVHSTDYTPEALEIARREFLARGVDAETLTQLSSAADVPQRHKEGQEQAPLEGYLKNSVIRILRGCAAFLANALAVLVGVGILKTLSSFLVQLFIHSRVSIILTEWIGSIVFAALLGISVQQRWRTRTARWVWIPFLVFFLFALATRFGFRLETPWRAFSGIACAQARGACIPFTVFTMPLVRASAYSLAAFLSARFGRPESAEFHPVLSYIFSGLFLVGLPKVGTDQSPKKVASTNPDNLE